MKKVLIMEDEVNIRSFVVINLKRAGYDVIEAGTGQAALDALAANPDIGVAILDIMLPDIDGFEVCRRIRANNKQMGIIMLTARTQEMDKVTGLMTGADDYVTKPFSPAELTARIDALYRRIGGDSSASSELLTQGPFVMNTRNHTLEKMFSSRSARSEKFSCLSCISCAALTMLTAWSEMRSKSLMECSSMERVWPSFLERRARESLTM